MTTTRVNWAPRSLDDEDSNRAPNPNFDSIVQQRLSRRSVLSGSVGSLASALWGGTVLSGCVQDSAADPAPTDTTPIAALGFVAVDKSLLDALVLATGYTATVIYALGDPLAAGVPEYQNDGTDIDFENRAGDHHDGMEWFGLGADGSPSASATDRGLLAINHEATTDEDLSSFFLHADGGTRILPRPAAEVDKELAIHGISVVEVRKTGSVWGRVGDSDRNWRMTPLTDAEVAGPARGNALLITRFSPDGTRTRGTLNNCGTGKSPWGSFVTGEENWGGYFTRPAPDDMARGDKSVIALARYGRAAGRASRHGWETAGTDDKYARWNIAKTGVSLDGSDDYRNEMNGMGYLVEIDPYDRTRLAKKRTAAGRFAHESAAFGLPVAGQPIAVYQGDDARNEYIYKFVSTELWDPADANPTDRLATGDKYLDSGKLYVAKFNADGTGEWLELSTTNPAVATYEQYAFADQADVCVNARIAADAAGATKMDRPEWCAVSPISGEIYVTLTNNADRRIEPSGTQLIPDGANPRVYTDIKGSSSAQQGNPNGHIVRIKENGGNAATGFTWDVYLFGAEASAAPAVVNLSKLTADQDFSSPDGIAFSRATGVCWIQTDDSAHTDVTNCMLLAALPGLQGDGEKKTLIYNRADGTPLLVETYVGKAPTEQTLRRFLVGPVGCEITGLAETPDGKTLFVNIQHPGETTRHADIADPTLYTSHWPGNAGYGPGGATARPRSATIAITKDDGGRIGA